MVTSRKPRNGLIVLMISTVSVALGVGVIQGQESADPATVIEALAEDRVPSDAFPSVLSLDNAHPGFADLETTRRIGSTEEAMYWVSTGRESPSDICISVFYNPQRVSSSWVFGTSCADSGLLAQQGLWLQVSSPNGGKDVLLLPDATDLVASDSEISDAGGQVIGQNLVTFPLERRPGSLILQGPIGPIDIGVNATAGGAGT